MAERDCLACVPAGPSTACFSHGLLSQPHRPRSSSIWGLAEKPLIVNATVLMTRSHREGKHSTFMCWLKVDIELGDSVCSLLSFDIVFGQRIARILSFVQHFLPGRDFPQ